MAYSVMVERTVAMPRAKVFAYLMDFGGIKKLLPDMLGTCSTTGEGVGCVRTLTLNGAPGTVVERLDGAYDGHYFSYSIIGECPLPLEHYHAVVMLEDAADGGCFIRYGSNWTAKGAPEAEVVAMLTGLYNTIVDAIVKAG